MHNLTTFELKPFVPARDFELSRRFYTDLGFTVDGSDPDLAYVSHGNTAFLLQNFYKKEFADGLLMQLLVQDLDSWWQSVNDRQIVATYAQSGVRLIPPRAATAEWADSATLQSRSPRHFVLFDPTGVRWRIAQPRS